MSFQLIINNKPVIFKSGIRMNKQLDKVSEMTLSTDDGNIKHFAGAGAGIINQFMVLLSQKEQDSNTLLALLSNLLFAMQKEVSADDIDDYLDGIEDEKELSQIVQKVYDELPKSQKSITLKSKKDTPRIV